MKIYITHISRKIKNLREEKKLTQEELAEKLGISRQSIISVEKGKCLPSLPLALRISELFDLAFDEIFGNQKTHIKEEGNEKIMPHPLTSWSPFSEADPFFEDENTPAWPGSQVVAFPAVNIKQGDKQIVLIADIPGVKEDELQVEVGSDFVDISGERKEEEKIEEEGYFRQEVRYGSFARRILLPAEIKTDKTEATIKDGILKLVMPKIEAIKPKVTKIKIKKA
ncbi:MAG: Hsp20 family protein [Patescibacteria group bacterium]|nr:Hsp20 family protein [Patescibacteria group bacterium]